MNASLSSRLGMLLLVFAIGGCARTWVDFQPYSAQNAGRRKVVNRTVVAYEGDIEALVEAEGILVGTLTVGGNGFADEDDIAAEARIQAADRGGTHVIPAGKSSSVDWAQVTPDTYHTSVAVNGNTSTAKTTYQPGASIPITRHRAGFVVVRVPVERWQDLPPSLRPVYGQHFRNPETERAQRASARTVEGPARTAPKTKSTNWRCTSWPDGYGLCFRGDSACQDARVELTQYDDCFSHPIAECIVYDHRGKRTMTCHPDRVACQIQRDLVYAMGDSVIEDCTLSE